MKKDNQQLEVLEPEVEEIPLEEVINNSLVKHNVTDAVIASLKEKYGDMRLTNIEDKENYLEIKEARKEVRKVGILTEKLCKKGREDAVAIQRKWLTKEREILSKIAEVENPLNAEIEKFDNEVERKELAEAKLKEEIYINRQAVLLKYGAQYNNGSFELNHISYEVELIKAADDEQWNDTILPKYRKVFEEIETVKVAEESKRKEELAQQKKEREEFELQQKKFKEEQELFAKQQRELQKQKDEIESIDRQKRQMVVNDRMNQLRGLGMSLDHIKNSYSFEDINVDVPTQIIESTMGQWNSLIEKITPVIEQRKKDAEEKRIAQLEKEKQAAIELAAQQEREKIAVEQRLAELEKQKEAIRKQQELEASKDKEKYASIVEYLKHFPNLIMTSNFYKGKMNEINDFINDL